jgi:hypothetical protein
MDYPDLGRRLFGLLTALIFVIGMGIAPAVAAEVGVQQRAEKTVTLTASRMAVVDAIDLLFKDTGYKYKILPGVSGTITLALNNVAFDKALRSLADTADLQYQIQGSRYVISAKPKPVRVSVSSTAGSDQPPLDGQQPPAQEQPPMDQPVYYGHDYAYPVPTEPTYYDIGNLRLYVLPPFTREFVTNGNQHIEVPPILPPPGLRSPSLQRFIDQMNEVRSFPGYPGPYYGGY